MKKEKPKSQFKLKVNFNFKAVNNKTGEIVQQVSCNTVVDNGRERVAKLLNGVLTTPFTVLGIGTGSTAVTTSDVQLETEVTRETSTNTYEANFKAKFEHTFTFGSGESHSITEAGIFDNTIILGSTMFNRTVFTAIDVNTDIDLITTATITVAR